MHSRPNANSSNSPPDITNTILAAIMHDMPSNSIGQIFPLPQKQNPPEIIRAWGARVRYRLL